MFDMSRMNPVYLNILPLLNFYNVFLHILLSGMHFKFREIFFSFIFEYNFCFTCFDLCQKQTKISSMCLFFTDWLPKPSAHFFYLFY